MLCLMDQSPRRGYLQHSSGKPVTADQLARMTGCSTDDVSRLLRELEDAGVYSFSESRVIYSRRMVRDERKRSLCSDAGRAGGGNPTFKGMHKGHVKGDPKGAAKRNAEDEVELSVSSSEETNEFADGNDVLSVFAHYRAYHPRAHPRPMATSKEWQKVRARLREGYSVDDLKLAIDGCHKSPFHMGENEGQKRYDSMELIFRDSSHIQQFIEIAGAPQTPVLSEKTMRGSRAAESALRRWEQERDNHAAN
jgi:biotin operon repressor